MRVLLAGGGTAGHINPAIAIGAEILRCDPESEIAFVGTERDRNNPELLATGKKLYIVKSDAIQRTLSPSNIRALYRAVAAPMFPSTHHILEDFRPDVVIGTGGYTCWPILCAAVHEKIPTAVHESNAIPGLAVRMLGRFVHRIYTNFESTKEHLPRRKVLCVGNPLRREFCTVNREDAKKQLGIKEPFLLISFGGSLGAGNVNRAVLELMKEYTSKNPWIRHVHATGRAKYESEQNEFVKMGLDRFPNLELRPYLDNMPIEMSASDLVICRAGAMTTSELAMSGRAAVMIPFPAAADNHQYINAKTMEDAGAVRMVTEDALPAGALVTAVKNLAEDDAGRARLEMHVSEFATPHAAERIYEDLLSLISQKKKK